jgi:hypothetical protein
MCPLALLGSLRLASLIHPEKLRRIRDMKLKQSNPHLKSGNHGRDSLWQSAKSSSAIEGIRKPFADGPEAWKPASAKDLIDHWKQRSLKSGR